MPRKKKTAKRVGSRAKNVPTHMRVASVADLEGMGIFGDINNFFRKNKLISRGAKIADIVGVPHAGKVAKAASILGYGLVPAGGSLRLPGGALMLPGERRITRRRTTTTRRKAPARKKKAATGAGRKKKAPKKRARRKKR